ncbi:hypothetical protein E2C01_021703 [Portunus trituberculatus]|uniref:Uncharacterized protein n=1 Tax=Portunus trituberculatus TaxID=210409 RepID=A0A5B7E581_PORTR|nr:hypothetical protein [Portunus trituberculatus]
MTKTQKMPLINIKSNNFFKELIQSLIGVCNNKSTFSWVIVVYVRYNLNSNICFACPWRPNNHVQHQSTFFYDVQFVSKLWPN